MKKAHTLAEIVVAMIIIAVVASISIKISKTKLDKVTSYAYYTAYSTLRSAVREMVAEFNTEDADYGVDRGGCEPDMELSSGDTPECIRAVTTVPRTGALFCNKVEKILNINSGSCAGTYDSTSNSITSPDLVLRNGMQIFIAPKTAAEYRSALASNDSNTSSATVSDTGTYAYTVYVDIDGRNSGNNTLWDDIYPFYVTLSGKVIPAIGTGVNNNKGGNDRKYLQASVDVDDTSNPPNVKWLVKSVTFKEAACTAGHIKGTYCGSVTKHTDCGTNDCRLHIITPIKGF